ncbi:hypothetical protein C2E31_26245 [Rhodopirellula baltica]|nr:hypothetical protein C2E31_26245 [Rhodopirellula baltica]
MASPDPDATFNRLILLAIPKLSSGDSKDVSSTVRDAATKCSLTLMASVQPVPASQNTATQYRLADVGAGYSVATDLGRQIVSSATASDQGVSLGFIPTQVLRTSEQQLERVTVVGKSDHVAIFDAPSIMHRRDKNQRYVTRHFVYIDPNSGEGAMLTWLMAPISETKTLDAFPIIDHPIRMTPFETVENRRIHVDGNEFNFLGVPSEKAFGLVDLPPGNEVAWDKETARLAGRLSYDATQLQSLSQRLAALLNRAR